MATYTKAQILTLIAEKIADNSTKNITPAFVRDVLVPFTDMLQDSELIKYQITAQGQTITNVKEALNVLLSVNIPDWQDIDWPDLYFVHYEKALYRSNDVVKAGDGEPDNSAKWDLIIGGSGDEMTPEEIVTALETLTINSCLSAAKVKFGTGISVTAKIGLIDAAVALLQPKLYNSRFFVTLASPNASYTITNHLLHPVNFFLNGKYYNGRQASNFNPPFSSYDYRYAHSGNNTIFTFNPLASGNPMFANGDTLDLVHSSVAIGDPTP